MIIAAARAPLSLALGCVGFSPRRRSPCRSGDEQGEVREQNVVVTGERESEAGYRVSRGTSGMRTDTPLIERRRR